MTNRPWGPRGPEVPPHTVRPNPTAPSPPTGTTAPTTSTAYIFAVVSSPQALVAFLTRPRNLAIWVAVVVGIHFLIWSGEGAWRWWHCRLTFLGLK